MYPRILRGTPLLFTFASLMTLSGTVSSQPEIASDREIPTIYVDGLLPGNISLTPGAADTLDAEAIERLRAYSMHDLLDFMPGLRTIDDDILGRRTAIGVRGAPPRRSRKTLLLEDGTPINFSAYLDASAHYSPPMERLEGVDVLKGAGHILNGPLNNHGIVNFRNRRPTAEPNTQIEFAAGNLNTFKRHLLHSRTDGNVGTVFSYTGADADGAFDVEKSRFDDLFVSMDWLIDGRQELGLSLTWYRERSYYDESNLTPQEYAVAPDTKRGRFSQEYNNFGLDYIKADAVHHIQLTPEWLMSTRVFATDADRPRFTVDPENIFVDALPQIVLEDPELFFVPGVQGEMIARDRYYRTYGMENRMEYAGLSWAGLDHTLQWGVRAERHFLDDMRRQGEEGEKLRPSNRGSLTRDVTFQASAATAYVQDVISVNENWTITPGVRAEYFTQSRQRRSIARDSGPHDRREKEHTAIMLPSLSLLYTGLDRGQIFMNVARGYTPAPARTAEDFPLRSETGINTQLGIRTAAWPGLMVEAAAFYNRITDTVVQLPFSIDGSNIVLNSADSRSYGVDLGMQAEYPLSAGAALSVFSVLAYNYTRAEFTENLGQVSLRGNRVPEIPEHAGSITLGLRHDRGWELSATLSHFGDFYTDPLNTRALVLADEDREPVQPGDLLEIREPAVLGQVPSHTLLSARASYRFAARDMQLWIQGRNLQNRRYISDLENGIRPGAPRTLMAGVRIGF